MDHQSSHRFPWRTGMVLTTMLALAALAAFAWVRTLEAPARIAREFKTGRISESFHQQLTQIRSTHGDILEVATAESEERLSRSDSLSLFGEALSLGTTTSEIRVPVTYRYHVRLSDPWTLSTEGNVCRVIAPPLRPSLPPAIHTDRMDKQTDAGWLRFNAQANLDALEKSVTPRLAGRAADPQHIALVRETARQSVAEFVRHWLLTQNQWQEGRFEAVTVEFADEPPRLSPGRD
jgi:hypothetical protein